MNKRPYNWPVRADHVWCEERRKDYEGDEEGIDKMTDEEICSYFNVEPGEVYVDYDDYKWYSRNYREIAEVFLKMEELLKAARCPNSDCYDGVVSFQEYDSRGEIEWRAELCQWCAERSELFKWEKEKGL